MSMPPNIVDSTVKVANVVCENLVCDMCFGKFEHLQVGPVGFSYGIWSALVLDPMLAKLFVSDWC